MVLESPLEVRGVANPPSATAGAPPPDIIIADFEGDHYPPGPKTPGTAFGTGPVKGSLPGQTTVHGFPGKGLANSMLPNDAAKGTLTSPTFTGPAPLRSLPDRGWETTGSTPLQAPHRRRTHDRAHGHG